MSKVMLTTIDKKVVSGYIDIVETDGPAHRSMNIGKLKEVPINSANQTMKIPDGFSATVFYDNDDNVLGVSFSIGGKSELIIDNIESRS